MNDKQSTNKHTPMTKEAWKAFMKDVDKDLDAYDTSNPELKICAALTLGDRLLG